MSDPKELELSTPAPLADQPSVSAAAVDREVADSSSTPIPDNIASAAAVENINPNPQEDAATSPSLETAQPTAQPSVTPIAAAPDTSWANDEMDEQPTVVLPMQLASLEDAARTDVGQQREHNEDFFGISTRVTKIERPIGRTVYARGVYILCDGMGGHAGGEVASQLAVETLQRYFEDYWESPEGQKLPSVDMLKAAVQLANKAIYDRNQADVRVGSGRMGTTLVMVMLHNTAMAVVHVGDSRLYRYTRKRGLEQLTLDHEVGQREILRGVEPEHAYARADAYQLTQALGPRDEEFVDPEVKVLELSEDALLLLASDGLTDNDCLERHCQTYVEPLISSQTNLDQGLRQLIELANDYNGHDNITAIAIRAKLRPSLELQA